MDNQVIVGKLKVKVIKKLCIGCGTCVALAPKTFEMGKDMKAFVKIGSTDSPKTVKDAADSCATQAIIVEE